MLTLWSCKYKWNTSSFSSAPKTKFNYLYKFQKTQFMYFTTWEFLLDTLVHKFLMDKLYIWLRSSIMVQNQTKKLSTYKTFLLKETSFLSSHFLIYDMNNELYKTTCYLMTQLTIFYRRTSTTTKALTTLSANQKPEMTDVKQIQTKKRTAWLMNNIIFEEPICNAATKNTHHHLN